MWTSAICFGHIVTQRDKDGFETQETTWGTPVRASFTSLTRADETLAQQRGYAVDVKITLHKANYTGQSFLKDAWTGDIYDIRRTHTPERSMQTELYCEKRERGKAVLYHGQG